MNQMYYSNMRSVLVLISCLILLETFSNAQDDILVTINQGVVRGQRRQAKNGDEFFGFGVIPYAEPPVNELRFLAPVPHKGWIGIWDEQNDLPVCPQQMVIGQGIEDCLYLNVFTKNYGSLSPKSPVMVFFHGGGYLDGSGRGELYDPTFLLSRDVVVVVANYRLGIFGFLNFAEDKAIVGNSGMKDQSQVLRWVNENIASFGGDPDRVTIFGESAGGSSVHAHMFSPLSKGLFHGVIAESGSILEPWAVSEHGSGELVAQEAGIEANDNKNVTLAELQKIDTYTLVEIAKKVYGDTGVDVPTLNGPVVEGSVPGAFLEAHPRELLASGLYTHVPLLMGYNDKEGIFIDFYNKLTGQFLHLYEVKHLIPHDLGPVVADAVEKIHDMYFEGRVPSPENPDDTQGLIDAITDSWFFLGIREAVSLHARNRDFVYFYRFSASTKLNYLKLGHPETAKHPGASHVDELGYLFKTLYTPAEMAPGSIEDVKIEEMVTMWTNFAYLGKPTEDNVWTPVSSSAQDLDYYSISNEESQMLVNPDHERYLFWESLKA